MNWYNYIACFFAGMFPANFLPHFVYGISADRFPTPFAHPPGKGLSSSTVNVVLGTVQSGRRLHVVWSRKSYERRRASTCNFLRGIAAISSILSVRFPSKQAACAEFHQNPTHTAFPNICSSHLAGELTDDVNAPRATDDEQYAVNRSFGWRVGP